MGKWVFLMQAYNDMEAALVCGLLGAASIPALQKASDPLAEGMRVVGGQAHELDIYVPEKNLPQARALLLKARGGGEGAEDRR